MTDTTLGTVLAETGGSIKTGPFGTALKAAEYSLTGVPVISVGEVGRGSIVLQSKTPMVGPTTVERLAEYVLKPGDVVFGRKGSVDRSAWVKPSEDGYFLGSDGIRVRFGSDVDSRFFAYQFQSPGVRDWLLQHAAGSTMASLNQAILERVPLRSFPRNDQRAISEVLGALDDKIAANAEVGRLSNELAGAFFAAARASAVLSDNTFADVADIAGGATPKTSVDEYWHGEVRWATPTDVTALSLPYIRDTSRHITEGGLAACSSPHHVAGSILMTSRATIGAFAIAEVPMAVNQGFIVVNSKGDVPQWWLFHEMRSRVGEFISHANGATFLELSRGKFKHFRVHLAEASEMQSFAGQAEVLHHRASAAARENMQLAATRDELLPLLMAGKVRVKDVEKVVEGVM